MPPTPTSSSDDSNPFLEDAEQSTQEHGNDQPVDSPKKIFNGLPAINGLEWRIAEGLLGTLFSLIRAYADRGSPREAEYFVQQAMSLAKSLDTPAMVSRADARAGEIQLHLGQLEECFASLTKAAELASDVAGPDAAEIFRLRAEHSRRGANGKEAQQLYADAMSLLEELDDAFIRLDGANSG